jgi:hypothetical protein
MKDSPIVNTRRELGAVKLRMEHQDGEGWDCEASHLGPSKIDWLDWRVELEGSCRRGRGSACRAGPGCLEFEEVPRGCLKSRNRDPAWLDMA